MRSASHPRSVSLALAAMLALALATMALMPPRVGAGGPPQATRFATFNASLNRNSEGQALADLSAPGNAQASAVAEIIQRTRPEVLLINEFDYVDGPLDGNDMTDAFQQNYLGIAQHDDVDPITYPYVFVAPSNTGLPSGFDLSNDDNIAGPNDAHGFGFFPGQFGMAVFSMHPIDYAAVRTFQLFKWVDMPGALLPDDPATPDPADWYSEEELTDADHGFRLSSKSHWDVPISIGGTTVHFLVSHPTPPVFDGPPDFPAGVDFNGRRNFDEIRFWADYVTPGAGGYIYDDDGGTGGLRPGSSFVIAGDENSDPLDGDSIPGSIQLLLENPRVNTSFMPSSEGAVEAAAIQGGANATHRSDPAFDTADFADGAPGNLHADYVLPSRNLRIVDAAVFWPTTDDPLFRLTGRFPFPSSDHRLVWVDVIVPGSARGG
jgi:hypothetical protein